MPLLDDDARAGVRLLTRTLGHYRRDMAISVTGALMWMVGIVSLPWVTSLIIDRAIVPGDAQALRGGWDHFTR